MAPAPVRGGQSLPESHQEPGCALQSNAGFDMLLIMHLFRMKYLFHHQRGRKRYFVCAGVYCEKLFMAVLLGSRVLRPITRNDGNNYDKGHDKRYCMDLIRKLLVPPVAADTVKQTGKAHSTGLWQGHGVQVIPLDRELQAHTGVGEASYELAVKKIGQRYGTYVRRQLESRYAKKTVPGNREIRKLDSDARKLLYDVQKTNRKNVDTWIRQGLVPDIYEETSNRPWQSLPAHERQHLCEGIINNLGEKKELLQVATVGKDTAFYMARHQSLYSCSAPRVADYLERKGVRVPVMPGYLRDWAEAGYFGAKGVPAGSISRMGLALARNMDVYSNRTAKLLYESPLDKTVTTSLTQQGVAAREHAKDLLRAMAMVAKHGKELPDELYSAVVSDLRGQVQSVAAHIRRLEVLEANNPVNRKNWKFFKQNELAAAIAVLAHERQMLVHKSSSGVAESRRYNRIRGIMEKLDHHYALVTADKDGDLASGGE